ncbi:hypothetical protein MXB_4151 [Myxobolus squamalis]|nr:hypothetical protein MXB_4151 [Myxobolus squamalis]
MVHLIRKPKIKNYYRSLNSLIISNHKNYSYQSLQYHIYSIFNYLPSISLVRKYNGFIYLDLFNTIKEIFLTNQINDINYIGTLIESWQIFMDVTLGIINYSSNCFEHSDTNLKANDQNFSNNDFFRFLVSYFNDETVKMKY